MTIPSTHTAMHALSPRPPSNTVAIRELGDGHPWPRVLVHACLHCRPHRRLPHCPSTRRWPGLNSTRSTQRLNSPSMQYCCIWSVILRQSHDHRVHTRLVCWVFHEHHLSSCPSTTFHLLQDLTFPSHLGYLAETRVSLEPFTHAGALDGSSGPDRLINLVCFSS